MHHKTLQLGDEGNYVQNLTFYPGQTQTGTAIDSFVEKLRFTETPFEESPHKWIYLDKSDEETQLEQIAKSHRFNVAFGLSDLADQPDNIENHLYGNLVAMRTYRHKNGTLAYAEIPTVNCTGSDLQDNFYPARSFV